MGFKLGSLVINLRARASECVSAKDTQLRIIIAVLQVADYFLRDWKASLAPGPGYLQLLLFFFVSYLFTPTSFFFEAGCHYVATSNSQSSCLGPPSAGMKQLGLTFKSHRARSVSSTALSNSVLPLGPL